MRMSADVLPSLSFAHLCTMCQSSQSCVSDQMKTVSWKYHVLHAGWLVPSEVHDLNTRSAGQSITVFTQLLSGAIVTQV